MKRTREWIALFLLALIAPLLPGQADGSDQARQQADERYHKIDERLNRLTTELEQTHSELTAAVEEIRRLRVELELARKSESPEASAEKDVARTRKSNANR